MTDDIIPAFECAGLKREALQLKKCGHNIFYIQCKSCESKHFAGCYRCKSRWCFWCQRQNAICWTAKILQRIEQLGEKYNYHMITFTLRDSESLSDMMKNLNKAWRCYSKDKEVSIIFKKRFAGGVRSLEIKIGKNSGLWHAHYHLLVATSKEFNKDYDFLNETWKRFTNGEGSVHIKQVDNKLKASLEVVKYICGVDKQTFYNSQRLNEAVNAMYGKRQINTFGVFRGLSKQVEKCLETYQERKLIEFICQVCGYNEGELKTILESELKDILYD